MTNIKAILIKEMLFFLIITSQCLADVVQQDFVEYLQPNNVSFLAKAWGDELKVYIETDNGYRIIKNSEDRYWYYAQLEANGDYECSNYKVGIEPPVGIPMHLEVSEQRQIELLQEHMEYFYNYEVTDTREEIFLAVVLVEFNDIKHRNPEQNGEVYNEYTKAEFESMLFSENYYNSENGIYSPLPEQEQVFGSMKDYYDIMSNDNFILSGEIINVTVENDIPDWITLNHNKAEYDDNDYDFWDEVIFKMESLGYDTSTSDTRKLCAIYAGNVYRGGELHPQVDDIGGTKYIMGEMDGGSAVGVQEDPIDAPFSHIGVHAHEFGHLLGFYHSQGAGYYDVMFYGNRNGPNYGSCPATLNPYFRSLQGWITLQPLDFYMPVEEVIYNTTSSDAYIYSMETIPFELPEYGLEGLISELFTIENRQFSNTFDQWLPCSNIVGHSGGILIWHEKIKDYTFPPDYHEKNLTIITANGEFSYNDGESNCDVFFPGDDNLWSRIDDFTDPANATREFGGQSYFMIKDISTSGDEMTATFYPNYVQGDINSDGVIDILDIITCVNIILEILTPTDFQFWAAELNEDGEIDLLDIVLIVNIIMEDGLQNYNPGPVYFTQSSVENSNGDYFVTISIYSENPQLGSEVKYSAPLGKKIKNIQKSNQIDEMDFDFMIDEMELSFHVLIYGKFGQSIISGLNELFTIELKDDEESLGRNDNVEGEFSMIGITSDGETFNEVIELSEDELGRILNGADLDALTMPENFKLSDVYPNPFNPNTNITYEIPEKSHISISIYDLSGRKLEDLVNGTVQAGRFNTTWNAEQYSSGLYIINMTAPNFSTSQKVVLLK